MEHPPICPSCVADDPTKARGVSRGHLRSIRPPASSSSCEEHADELPPQTTNYDDDPDDPDSPPLTLLAW
jgi:hypothetical protein